MITFDLDLTIQLQNFNFGFILAGFAPTNHHEVAAGFAHLSADNIKQSPEDLANNTAAPCVSSLPKYSSFLAGDFTGGAPTGHTEDHFPG